VATHGRGIWIIDDISPWRALTASVLEQTAVFLPVPPAVQFVQAFGGWAEGDNSRPGATLTSRGDSCEQRKAFAVEAL